MILKDELGKIELDGNVLTELLKETFQMATAYTAEWISEEWTATKLSDKQTLKIANKIMMETWGNDEWLKNYIGYLFKRAREISPQPGPMPDVHDQPDIP